MKKSWKVRVLSEGYLEILPEKEGEKEELGHVCSCLCESECFFAWKEGQKRLKSEKFYEGPLEI